MITDELPSQSHYLQRISDNTRTTDVPYLYKKAVSMASQVHNNPGNQGL